MINLEGINKGDRVKIETYQGDTAEFTVRFKDECVIKSATNTCRVADLKSLEVIQKPLPTEPGLYKAENGGTRLFILDRECKWHILYRGDMSLSLNAVGILMFTFRNFSRIEL